MQTILIAVDVQKDFIDGSLGGEGRDRVIAPLLNVAKHADLVIASRDWHPADHESFSDHPTFEDGSWPPHCVQGTPGSRIDPRILAVTDVIVSKGFHRAIEAYSAFDGQTDSGVSLIGLLTVFGAKLAHDRVIVGGLVTEKCVMATALDSATSGYDTYLSLDGSMGLTEASTKEALARMKEAGIKLLVSTE